MAGGVEDFVNRNGQKPTVRLLGPKNLERRRQIAPDIKIKSASSFRAPVQPQTVPHDRYHQNSSSTRVDLGYIQSLNGYAPKEEGLFAESILGDDSDDTMRGLASGSGRGDQWIKHDLDEEIFENEVGSGEDDVQGDEFEKTGDLEGHEEDEGGDRDTVNMEDPREDGSDEESGQMNGRRPSTGFFPAGLTKEDLVQQVQNIQRTQEFMVAAKAFNDGPSFKSLFQTSISRSARFTPANVQTSYPTLGASAHQPPWEQDGTKEGQLNTRKQRNDERLGEDLVSSDIDLTEVEDAILRGGTDHGGQFEQIALERDIEAHNSHCIHQGRDMFVGSDPPNLPGQSSPSLRTPRAIRQGTMKTAPSVKSASMKRTAVELDYDERTLYSMKYAELKDQPFDSNPKAPVSVIPQELTGPKVALEVCLQHFAGRERDDQTRFFAQMSMEQWDQSGDWFLCRLGDIMFKLKDARQTKRNTSKAFEEELAVREEAVRGKSEGIQEVMRQMRAGGEGVLRGRML